MEDKIKDKWLTKLESIDSSWEDGDLDNENKTADLVNDGLKIAIELKNDTVFKFKSEVGGSLITLSNRYRGYARDANSKFSSYPSYRTILLIECEIFNGLLQNIFTGIQAVNMRTRQSFLKNKNLWESYPNIGCYLIMSKPEGCIPEFYYFKNPVAEGERILEKAEVEKTLNITTSLPFQEDL